MGGRLSFRFITDPQAVKLPSTKRLHELYNMTPTQAKVMCEFARGTPGGFGALDPVDFAERGVERNVSL